MLYHSRVNERNVERFILEMPHRRNFHCYWLPPGKYTQGLEIETSDSRLLVTFFKQLWVFWKIRGTEYIATPAVLHSTE